MKSLEIRNQVFPLHKRFSGLKRLQLRTFWMQRGQKTWFLTAPSAIWLTILLVLVLLPIPPQSPPILGGKLAMAAPALSPDATSLARQGPTVRIDPAESVVDVSETFTVTVMIDEADNLGAFEFVLLFITTTVTVDSVTLGDFLGSTGRDTGVVDSTINNQVGRVEFGAFSHAFGSVPGPSGTGVLATVALTARGPGESPLDLKNVIVVNTYGKPQTTTVEDGVVRVRFAIYLPLILRD